MVRWEPDARGRLEKAAMELFRDQGYPETTVEQIAARAGLTERTYFRYFVDKREVLFSGSPRFVKAILDGIEGAPPEVRPLEVVVGAVARAAADVIGSQDFDFVRARYELVTRHAEIQERELIKLASLAAAATTALHDRGVLEPAASLAAEAGIAVLKVGFARWVAGSEPHDIAAQVRAALTALKALTAEE